MGTTRYTVIDGEILSEDRNGVKRDYVPDPQGNTIALLNNTQTQTDTFSYYPYGEVASRTGTTQTPFQYLGTWGYYTDNSRRTYVRARHLKTTHGRWMTQDPIGFDGGDFNLYRYVQNSPVTLYDPSGNTAYDCWVKGANGIVQHRFISTNQCGTYGFYGDPNNSLLGICGKGIVKQGDDDEHLNETIIPNPQRKKGNRRIRIPGSGRKEPGGGRTTCTKLSNDPLFENALCRCMEASQKEPPAYSLPIFSCCIPWVTSMLGCACLKIGQGYGWDGNACGSGLGYKYLE